MTTRIIYAHELERLCENVEDMSNLVEASLNNLFFAIENKNHELAKQIIKDDRNVNDAERAIEAECLSLITKQQPIASDLRMVSSILKVVTDIERIGDHAADIAELVLRMNHAQLETYSEHIQPMITAAKEMVHDAVSAFISRDREKSALVIQSDDVVDELFDKVKNDITRRLKTEGANVDECIDVLLIAKYLERVGDHATNICEWEIFKETGAIEDVVIL